MHFSYSAPHLVYVPHPFSKWSTRPLSHSLYPGYESGLGFLFHWRPTRRCWGRRHISSNPWEVQHILRVLNTNIDGRRKIAFAITAVKGVGQSYAHVVLRKADMDLTKREGELTEGEVERVITIMQNPRQYKIPDWFLNRQKDVKDGK